MGLPAMRKAACLLVVVKLGGYLPPRPSTILHSLFCQVQAARVEYVFRTAGAANKAAASAAAAAFAAKLPLVGFA